MSGGRWGRSSEHGFGFEMKLTCVTATFNVIAAGNRERLIRCVESVDRIGIAHEHLVFDGASTDGTVELLRELAAKHPNLTVVSEPDTGIYNALNKGVRAARGAWFYVLGCDDEIVDSEEVVHALEEGERDGVDLVVAPVRLSVNPPVVLPMYRKYLFSVMPFCHQGSLMRMSLLRRFGGFDERFRIAADFDLVLKALRAAVKISYRTKVFASFGENGISSSILNCNADYALVAQENWGLNEVEVNELIVRNRLPLRVILLHIFHSSPEIRRAAWFHAARFALDSLGLLTRDGVLRFRRRTAAGRTREKTVREHVASCVGQGAQRPD